MMDKKLMAITFRNVVLASAYVFGVSQFMANGEKLFQNIQNLAPFVILLLLCLSAAVVGSLVFGQAVILFLEGKKSEGIKSAAYSIGWLFLITLAAISTLLVIY